MRLRLLGLGLLCLAGAALLVPPAPHAEGSLATAIGRSLGGLRIVVIDILFIRADALVRAGRADDLAEAQGLYQTILEFDPANDTAQAFLVDMYVKQMLPMATTREARFEWWRAGWHLAHRGLELNPDSAALHFRIAEMLLDVDVSPITYIQELRPLVGELVPHRRALLLDHLLQAMRIAENLPNRGFTHLSQIAVSAPEIAADAAREGNLALVRKALAAGRELLDLRGDRLSQIYTDVLPLGGGQAAPIDRRTLLLAGLGAVQRIRAAREAGDRGQARRVVGAYAEVVGQNRVLDALRRLAEAP